MIRFLLPLSLILLAGCSPLRAFDAFVPKDAEARMVARDQAFGPGKRGTLDLYAPRGGGKDLPVIVFFYGGSWNSGDKESYGFAGRALAAKGFLVAVPDYRIVPEARFPAFLEDGAAAVKWVRANAARFGGDPARIVLSGHSAGAYNATMLALDPKWLGADRAAVKGLAALAGPYDFPIDTPVTFAAFGADSDPAAHQPIRFASGDDPPALLLSGAKDEIVLPSQATGMAIALTDAGARAEAVVYPGIGHVGLMTALARPFRGKAPVLDDLARFAREVTAKEP